ncbi:serine/threonine-protein kinase atg1 [Acrasis kona]|uniref:Serine/threonine-protein kinase atg1 n=1 Tax=Acrasis kona TaxID=1008807 RepID=A0AAW2ZA70_9EUKA
MPSTKQIGKYTLTNNRLGSGMFGEVFEGYHTETQKKVAIKVMSCDKIINDEKLLAGLQLEIGMSRKLENDNIVRSYDFLKSVRYYYLVIEKCECDLQKFMEDNPGGLPPKLAQKFFQDLTNGLKAMHESDMIHRDLKPANLLLDRPMKINKQNSIMGDLSVIKIADFGLARHIHNGEMAKTMIGTPNYMAPEIMDNRPYDFGCDLYSCGVILYELLTGRLPWRANKPSELRRKIEFEKINFPPHVSPLAKDLISRVLLLDTSKRITLKDFYEHPYIKQSVYDDDDVDDTSNDSSTIHHVPVESKTLGEYDFDFDNISNAALSSQIRRRIEYACCVDNVASRIKDESMSSLFCLNLKCMDLLLGCIQDTPEQAHGLKTMLVERFVNMDRDMQSLEKALRQLSTADSCMPACAEDVLYRHALSYARQAGPSGNHDYSIVILECILRECTNKQDKDTINAAIQLLEETSSK